MSVEPAISVLLLSHNHARFVGEAIQSVFAQTWPHWELIVVDNHSTDGSWELLHACTRGNTAIRIARPERKTSIAEAFNFGLKLARSQYIARLDSDDLWQPEKLRQQMAFMKAPGNRNVGVCGTNCLLIDTEGRTLMRKDFPQTHEECRRAFWYRNPVCHTGALIRRECYELLGGYDETFNLAEDLELWFRLGQRFRLGNLPEYLTKVRISGNNVTLRQQRRVIASTLRARQHAITAYGYRPGPGGRAAMGVTWLMHWLPANLVHHVFNRFFLLRCSFLWSNSHQRAQAPDVITPPLVTSTVAPRRLLNL